MGSERQVVQYDNRRGDHVIRQLRPCQRQHGFHVQRWACLLLWRISVRRGTNVILLQASGIDHIQAGSAELFVFIRGHGKAGVFEQFSYDFEPPLGAGAGLIMQFQNYLVDAGPVRRVDAQQNVELAALNVDFQQINPLNAFFTHYIGKTA
jgi:hypothetical protein